MFALKKPMLPKWGLYFSPTTLPQRDLPGSIASKTLPTCAPLGAHLIEEDDFLDILRENQTHILKKAI